MSFTIKKQFIAMALLAFYAVAFLALSNPARVESQGTPGPITGYAWSDTIGWVSLNGSTYGLTADTNGKLSGYAWSDSIGWISANESELSGCPSNPCRAKIQNGQLNGWLKALSGGSAQSGGWDGFISLSGSNYGVTQSGGALSGYAWGSTVVGWLDFNATTGYEECTLTQGNFCEGNASKNRNAQCLVTINDPNCTDNGPGWFCGDSGLCTAPPAPSFDAGGALRVNPHLVVPGQTTNVTWDVDNATSCDVTEDNASVTDSWSGVSSALASCTHSGSACVSGAISQTTTYTLVCSGDGGTLTDTATVSLNPAWREL